MTDPSFHARLSTYHSVFKISVSLGPRLEKCDSRQVPAMTVTTTTPTAVVTATVEVETVAVIRSVTQERYIQHSQW